MKRCTRCQQEKPLEAFNRLGEDGRQAWCRDCNRAGLVERCKRQRRDCMLAYGDGRCAECGAVPDDLIDLELDHVNGDGKAHREALNVSGGNSFVSRLARRGWPNDPPLQTLCHDCHVSKTRRERVLSTAAMT